MLKLEEPYFKRPPARDVSEKTLADVQLHRFGEVKKAEGYIEAVDSLRSSLGKCPSPALLELLAPYLRDFFLGAEKYQKVK